VPPPPADTTQALSAIMEYYLAHGFTFVAVGQMFGFPGPVLY
jgi:hypothetical protein